MFWLIKNECGIPGKRPLIQSAMFLVGVVCALGVVAVLAISGVLGASILGYFLIMLITASCVKKLDSKDD